MFVRTLVIGAKNVIEERNLQQLKVRMRLRAYARYSRVSRRHVLGWIHTHFETRNNVGQHR